VHVLHHRVCSHSMSAGSLPLANSYLCARNSLRMQEGNRFNKEGEIVVTSTRTRSQAYAATAPSTVL